MSNKISFLFFSGQLITSSNNSFSNLPISFPGFIPAAIRSAPETAKSFREKHSFSSMISSNTQTKAVIITHRKGE